jgi:hypothetical protein
MHLLIIRGSFNDDFNSAEYVESDGEINSERLKMMWKEAEVV